MKKILITLCTLLAVGSGNYMYAPPPVKVETSKTEGRGTGRSETAGKGTTGPSEGAKSEASSGAEKQTMTYSNGKPTPDKFDVASSFNLDMSQGDGSLSAPQAGKRGSGETTHTLTRNDGSLYKIKIDQTGKVLTKQSFKNKFDSVGVDYDPAMRDSNGNPLTKQEAFQARRTQAQQATPEAKAAARTEVETQVSEAEAANPEAVEAARAKVDTAQENAPARKEAVDTASEEITTALESGDEAAVNTAVAKLADSLPQDVSPEQRGNFVTRLTTKIMEMGKQGIESIKSTINSLIETFSFSRPELEATSPDLESGRTSMESQTSEPDVAAAVPFKSYVDYKAEVDARGSGEASSPTAVADLSRPESPDLFAKEKTNASAGAEPSTRINNGVYTPAARQTSSPLLIV